MKETLLGNKPPVWSVLYGLLLYLDHLISVFQVDQGEHSRVAGGSGLQPGRGGNQESGVSY